MYRLGDRSGFTLSVTLNVRKSYRNTQIVIRCHFGNFVDSVGLLLTHSILATAIVVGKNML